MFHRRSGRLAFAVLACAVLPGASAAAVAQETGAPPETRAELFELRHVETGMLDSLVKALVEDIEITYPLTSGGRQLLVVRGTAQALTEVRAIIERFDAPAANAVVKAHLVQRVDGGAGAPLPEALAPALEPAGGEDMRPAAFALRDTAVVRVANGGAGRVAGVLATPLSNFPEAQGFYTIELRDLRMNGAPESGAMVRIGQLEFTLQIPMQYPVRGKEGASTIRLEWRDLGLNTEMTFRAGTPVLAGRLNLDPGGAPFYLVLQADAAE